MKRFYFSLTFLLAIAFTNIINAQAPAIEWQKCYGGSKSDYAQSIYPTSDGGFIVAGSSSSSDGDLTSNKGYSDYWIIKLNNKGSIQWQTNVGGSSAEFANSVLQTSDGGYIVAGSSSSNDQDVTFNHGGVTNYDDYWIVKLSSTGTIQWQKSLGGIDIDKARSIYQTADGGYTIAGEGGIGGGEITGNHGSVDFWIVKLNSSGNLLWQKSIGGNSIDAAYSIEPTTDGGFIVGGYSHSNDQDVTRHYGTYNTSDYWIVKLTSMGNIDWQKNFGGTNTDEAYTVHQTKDGGYIVGGSSFSNDNDVSGNHGGPDYWIVKLGSTGSIEWQKSLGGSGYDWGTRSLELTPDGGYIIAGSSNSKDGDVTGNHGGWDFWVVKLSSFGIIEWQKSLGGSGKEDAGAVRPTKDGGYIIAGSSESNDGDVTGNHGGGDLWIVKLSAQSCIPTINIIPSSTTICSGTSVTFTASAASTGTTPVYQWKVNGVNTGSNNPTFTSSALNNNDIITCELTSNATCATTTGVVSNAVKMTVNPSPIVSISGDTCVGGILTVSSNTAPASLVWTLNGTTKVSTQTAGINPNAITIAGGNGVGTNPNQLVNPNRLYIDAAGNMYIPDMTNARIQKWVPGATAGVTVAGGNGVGSRANQFDRPTSVAADSKGNLYITDQTNNRLQMWTPGAASGVSIGGYFYTPTAVFIDANDNIYVSEQNNADVIKIPANTTNRITVAGGKGYGSAANQLSTPTGIFADAAGNLYVCDTDNDRVQKWAPGATSGVTVAGGNGTGSGSNQLYNPLGIFVDKSGNIYISDFNNGRVQKWLPAATSGVTVAGGNGRGSGANELYLPSGIWVDDNGNVIVSDFYNNRVQKFSNTLTKTYTTLSAGDYTATVTSANGCTATSNIITVIASKTPAVAITSNGTAICPGVPVNFTASATYGGTAPVYQWKINGTNTGTASNNATFSSGNLKAGDAVSCDMVSNATICLTTKTVPSNSIKLTAASAGVASVKISVTNSTICKGAKITFTATPANGGSSPKYDWKVNRVSVNNSGSTFSPASLNDGDSVSCMVISNANLCPDNLTATSNVIAVHVTDIPVTSVTIAASNTIICEGTTVNLVATAVNGGSTAAYQWKVNGVNAGSDNASFTGNSFANGDAVSCLLTSSLPCAAPNPAGSNIIKMTVDKMPVLTIRPDTVIFLGSSIRLNTITTGNISGYQWSPSATLDNPLIKEPVATPASTTTYKLQVTTPGGCKATGQVTIKAITEVIISNAFSPNGDGVNDVWNIPGLSSYADCSVQIFNRYGALVFQSKGYNKPWDGTLNGQLVPVATYYYIITTDKVYGNKTGSVTVLR